MPDLVTNDPGLSVYFSVDVDGVELGAWTTCSGLGIEIETEARTDTAMSFMMHQIPGRTKYTNLVLGRPVSPDTARVMAWITSFAAMPLSTSAQVNALDPEGGLIMTWQLMGVVPVKWTGPSFDAAQLQIATEQLELAYQGFL
ncbi:MAG: phage tail protein [Actinomycetota bacterium]|nr:phage tail protein [Actinomycetota bacterium]